uniref:Uncharacterized protein n=1 Tax=Loigolactobacillus rennini TaxID=238013 RepID=A0A1K2I6T4_9LACO|nr:hypothetical protein LREN565_1172 [Loigolactobacillus rennini]
MEPPQKSSSLTSALAQRCLVYHSTKKAGATHLLGHAPAFA